MNTPYWTCKDGLFEYSVYRLSEQARQEAVERILQKLPNMSEEMIRLLRQDAALL